MMGQKINPRSNRLSLTRDWQSRWFAERNYATRLLEDLRVRAALAKRFGRTAAVGKIEIRRTVGGQIHILLHTAKPGLIIGRAGAGLAELRTALEKLLGLETPTTPKKTPRRPGQTEGSKLKIDVLEIKTPELWAQLVADNIANQIERRISHRRAIRQSSDRVLQAGAKGIKIVASGRLGGVEISRTEKFTHGSVPLSTFRADIDYGLAEAQTTFGTIGIKVWIHRGLYQEVEAGDDE
jgi:small subunit ribosomal protein S3